MSNLPQNPNPNPPAGETRINIFGYTPSLGWGVAALVIFGLCFAVNVVHLVRFKGTRTFHLLLLLGCGMELVGYGFRIGAHSNPFKLVNFVVQYFFIVTAPIFFSAAIYLSLAILTVARAEYSKASLLRPRTLVATFVVADCVTIAVQVVGAALVGVSESAQGRGEVPPIEPKTANDILLAGLCVQSFTFLLFLFVLLTFLWRTSKMGKMPDLLLVLVITTSAVLIFLRTLFRLAESADGLLSNLMTNEALFGGLETVPVLLAIAIWSAVPLAWRLRQDQKQV